MICVYAKFSKSGKIRGRRFAVPNIIPKTTSPPTSNISPATPSIQGGARKLYKSWSKSLNKLLKTKIF